MHHLTLGLIAFVIFALLDADWVGGLMGRFYTKELGPIGRIRNGHLAPRWGSVIFVYLLVALGMVLFVFPVVETKTMSATFFFGCLYGLVLYGFYNAENYAFIENYSLKMTLFDFVWGIFASGLTVVLTKLLASFI